MAIKDLTLITYFDPSTQQGLFGGISLPKWLKASSQRKLTEGKRADGPMGRLCTEF
jgi:hypothetical protein